jgi:hypothetical protein
MLAFNWKFLTPVSLVILVTTAILDKVLGSYGIRLEEGGTPYLYAGWMLMANLFIAWGIFYILELIEPERKNKRKKFKPRPIAVSSEINEK